MTTAEHLYTEGEVEAFFDQTLTTYLSFWDSDGVLHTGYFADDADDDYHGASDRTSRILADTATDAKTIDGSAYVLDVGSGCGNFLMYLASRFGCAGSGLDLSIERVRFARDKLKGSAIRNVEFVHGSATAMPYADGTFSHAVSQDALCLVPDKPASHQEIHRVLRPGGIFACTDFLAPKKEVSARARKHVFDRVRWHSGYSLAGYQAALESVGFEILSARNLNSQIRQTYQVLAVMARERAEAATDQAKRDWMRTFAESCGEIQIAIDDGEFGWGMLVARKRGEAR